MLCEYSHCGQCLISTWLVHRWCLASILGGTFSCEVISIVLWSDYMLGYRLVLDACELRWIVYGVLLCWRYVACDADMLRVFCKIDAMKFEVRRMLVVAGYISTDTKPSFWVVAVTWGGSEVRCITCCFGVMEKSSSCRVLMGFERTLLTSKMSHVEVFVNNVCC